MDTSLVSTDNINNPRTMNAVYNLLPRLEFAKTSGWGREHLAGGSLDNRQFTDPPLDQFCDKNSATVWTPHVLKDGADSVGALGALNRVYLPHWPLKWQRDLILIAIVLFGTLTWILTWLFPVTLMLLIAYSCDGSTRQLAARANEHFGTGPGALVKTKRWYRPLLMAVLLALTVAIPIGLLVYAVSNDNQVAGTRRLFVGLLGLALALAMSWWLRLTFFVPHRRRDSK